MEKCKNLKKCKKLDVELINQFNNEKGHWIQILKQSVTVIKFKNLITVIDCLED